VTPPVSAVGGTSAAAPAAGAPAVDKTAQEQGEGFERMLLGQLTKSLVDSALGTDDASSAAVTAYKDMLPDALTEALMSGGGIGLAASLQEGLR
jgi:Rod binding domain-containing protein